ncbi:Uncharacterised protein (plasmid) [Tsukamurella tyrosinosolvens]|uniref:Uncharacterized protein n=1 Tax=Tsukamurella tyrosinosolvens TaxID=57704 RepID=A0A1H4VAB8_TSUTY|nr:hypothetical protein [Tsukamurella tyrosinosolvens]KXO91017.1 hypothetical protein AXK58_21545 [Tsukamurella tyrosinosolvens]SEC77810.1 hypothetical protein SAMN04489793_3181 [Tsukamurella tyrosinosolvens]VEH90612.1 Uncharacterised protein [Tsukamurella tyrosinosolvens]
MSHARASALSERVWEVPTLHVGGALPDPVEYPDYAGADDACGDSSDHHRRQCCLAVNHPGDLHAAATRSGVIVAIWEEEESSWLLDW